VQNAYTLAFGGLLLLGGRIADYNGRKRTFIVGLLGFAGVALLLAAVGLGSAIAYAVSQRTREIGIRIALGARPADVLRMVFGEGLWTVASGLVAGVVSALLLTRFLKSLLFEVGAGDPITLLAAIFVLALVSLAAHWAPARRATRVDPMTALRSE
jgi:ABC-type antimicrobial peptide transport system permease subunit